LEIHEGVELPEVHAEHAASPDTIRVSVTISILAVLVAAVTLLGHRAHTEELLLQSHASDQWAYYQAKNIRQHEDHGFADLLAALTPQDKQKAASVGEKYAKEAERYQDEKTEIGDKAKELEKERDVVSRRADRFDGGEALLEVGLVICSITLLTKKRAFWFGGILIGAIGVALALSGFLLH
jgi:hypothetical protein